MNAIQATVKDFIFQQFLPGADPVEVTETTPLLSSGILTSLDTIRLVSFLEGQYHILLEAHESGMDYLDTLNDIAELVERKQKAT